ncbi:MAG: oligosaccharide flippase family protein [Candidatus Electryonea clarkiae]|nr:oligosaccharide flippase family protein [Candidatus Electryonea clarkiae]MDP8286161.1 oligosaccharide flippase family protein [Candidatus Electryonea clarkiae]
MLLIKHSTIYLGARIIPAIVSIVSLAVFTRIMLPEEYGIFVLLIGAADLMDAFLVQWLYLSLMRYAAEYESKTNVFYSTIFATYLTALIAALIATALGCAFYYETVPLPLFFIGFLYFAANGWFELNLQRVRAALLPFRFGLLDILRAVFSFLFAIVFVKLGWGAAGLLTGYMLGRILPTLLLNYRLWRGSNPLRYNRELIIKLYRFGLPLGIGIALAFVINASGKLMLGLLSGPEAAGLFGAGYDLVYRALVALMAVINLAGYPLIVKALESEGIEKAKSQLHEYFIVIFGISLATTLTFVLLPTEFANLMLGESFRKTGAMLIPWAAAAIFLSGIRTFYFNYAFQLGERTVVQIWVMVGPVILNIILNLIWIPVIGVMGVVYAGSISYFLALIITIIVGTRIFPIPLPLWDTIKTCIAVGGWCLVLIITSSWHGTTFLLVRVMLAALGGLSVALILNILGSRELLTRVIQRLKLKLTQ